METPVSVRKTHTDLILLGVFSLWWHVLGLGFLVLWLVRNRFKALSPLADRAEQRSLQTALSLGQISVLLLFLSLIGIVLMVKGHSDRSRRTLLRNEQHNVTYSGSVRQESP